MHNITHKKLIDSIIELRRAPADSKEIRDWIEAKPHLELLRRNACADELAIYASGENTFVYTVAVPNERLEPVDQNDLLKWSVNPFTPIASYVSGGGRKDVWIERGLNGTGTRTLENAVQLIFGRTFEGWTGSGGTYYDLNHEYVHLAGIHWRPERRSFCRFNEHGDLESVVSVTTKDDKGGDMALISFKWGPLEEYLAASNASLVQMFDFMLFRDTEFTGWSEGPPQVINESSDFFYRQKVMAGHAAYTRGVQIIRPRRSRPAVFTSMTGAWFGRKNEQYADFIAYDWRNKQVTTISTDPSATTNYFEAERNALPFELSPAFFRPDVLLKYKADRDKYTVGEREVSCRAGWHLQGIDVNEAGQVHAYICYLRRLPYSEQLHWQSYNERPKASISTSAVTTDFEGKWLDDIQPPRRVLEIAQRWHSDKAVWWTLRDEKLLQRVNTPLTESRDEWAEAFMDLAKLIVEGFETSAIRARLDASQVSYGKEDKTIALLEKLAMNAGMTLENQKLGALRTLQHLRTKLKGHVGGSEAEQLAHDAIMQHETFANHFRHVCTTVADEIEAIEELFSQIES